MKYAEVFYFVSIMQIAKFAFPFLTKCQPQELAKKDV